jgi:hypothetical protein
MKVINYKMKIGMDENPNFVPVSMTYSEDNLEIAKKEAYNGEYQISEESDEIEE